jgi:hypothetical protein
MSLKNAFRRLLAAAILSCSLPGSLVFGQWAKKAPQAEVTEASVREILTALASDAMNGRASASADELKAAQYIGERLKAFGIEPAGDNGTYLQSAKFTRRSRNPEQNGKEATTTNALGILRGTDPKLKAETILLSAHLDHLGKGDPVNGDSIYNGADDDASGCTAVLELARVLGAGPKPKRTVLFALFGSEEIGGRGARYFLDHPPVPLASIVANLEFEMIGRADEAVKSDELWLTGYERSNLGSTLAAHGAKLVADPHPEQQFFYRSDNIALARQGVVAQTVSSYGLHSDYHQPSDDVAHIDFPHMTAAINSMVEPVRWLVNSDFKPAWTANGKPGPGRD